MAITTTTRWENLCQKADSQEVYDIQWNSFKSLTPILTHILLSWLASGQVSFARRCCSAYGSPWDRNCMRKFSTSQSFHPKIGAWEVHSFIGSPPNSCLEAISPPPPDSASGGHRCLFATCSFGRSWYPQWKGSWPRSCPAPQELWMKVKSTSFYLFSSYLHFTDSIQFCLRRRKRTRTRTRSQAERQLSRMSGLSAATCVLQWNIYCLPLWNGIVLSNQNLLKCNQRSYTVLINIYIYINMSSCPLSTSSIPETSPTFKKYLDDPVLQQQVLQTGRKSSNKLPEWMGGPVFLQIWWLHATGSMFLDLRSRPRALRGEWNVADIRLLAMRSPWPTHLKMRLW